MGCTAQFLSTSLVMEAGCLHCKNQGHMRHDDMLWRLRPLVCWSRTVTRRYPPPRPEAASPWHRLHLKFAAHCDQQMGLWWPLGVANAINAIMVQADEPHFPKNCHVMPVMPREKTALGCGSRGKCHGHCRCHFPAFLMLHPKVCWGLAGSHLKMKMSPLRWFLNVEKILTLGANLSLNNLPPLSPHSIWNPNLRCNIFCSDTS